MRFFAFTAALTLFASSASALMWDFDSPELMELNKRQVEGPQYDCHVNCGFSIRGARTEGYCTNSTWVAWFEGCLDCANEFNMWPDYGDSVTAAASGCGLEALNKAATAGNATASASASSGSGSASASATSVSGLASASEAGSTTAAAATSSDSSSAASATSEGTLSTTALASSAASASVTEAAGSGAGTSQVGLLTMGLALAIAVMAH